MRDKFESLVRSVGWIMFAIAGVAAGLYFAPFAATHLPTVGKILFCSLVAATMSGAAAMLLSKSTSMSDKDFDEKIDETRRKIEAQVSSLIATRMSAPVSEEKVTLPAIEQLISPLQQDAISLAMRLLSFLESQGAPPTPKYTRKQIDEMNSAQTKALIQAGDRDFDFACEYYFGGNLSGRGPHTADELHKQIMARFMLLEPWYEALRARYELDFRADVERMNNRFAIEHIADEILTVPVHGKMSREYIRAIASKLWELAFKVREKDVKIETV